MKIIDWCRATWKRMNTSYLYKYNDADEFLDGKYEIIEEIYYPFYLKIQDRCRRFWLRRKALDFERWIAYRTYDKYHMVWTGENPGYRDKDHQMARCIIQLLKDYFEKELGPDGVNEITAPFQPDDSPWSEHDRLRHEEKRNVYNLYLKVKDIDLYDYWIDGYDELTEILCDIVKARGTLWS